MDAVDSRRGFEPMSIAGGGDARALAAGLKREPTGIGLCALAALALHAAIASPERIPAIYDAAAKGWFGKDVKAPAIRTGPVKAAPISPEFWAALWSLLDQPRGTLDAGGITQRTAALSGLVSPTLQARLADAPLEYPGVRSAVAQGYPARFGLEALAACPDGSLGRAFHKLIVDNGFDLEVLDREALGLAHLPPTAAYVNARILQCHDLWHIVAGYETTGLHEVAISAFQMAQFGHHYSAVFLAMVLTRVAFEQPQGAALMLDTILGAWVHGRESPPLLGVRWEGLWDRPVDAVRTELGQTPFASPWPANLFEQMVSAA